VTVTCPGDTSFTIDITNSVFLDRNIDIVTGALRHGEVTFPPFASENDPLYSFVEIDRKF
jgi:hypothetical protein